MILWVNVMVNQYITVKKFAEIVGVTPQAIYKKLTTSLQPYFKQVGNQKMLNIQALEDIYNINVDNFFKPNDSSVDNSFSTSKTTEKPENDEKAAAVLNEFVAEYKSIISNLEQEVEDQKQEKQWLKERVEHLEQMLYLEQQKNQNEVLELTTTKEELQELKNRNWWQRLLNL